MDTANRLAPLGKTLFGAGIVLLVLRGLNLTTRMPGLPAFWYAHQALWVGVAIGLTAMGWQILWKPWPPRTRSWQPSNPGRRFRTATLYVGDGCHLCEDAASIIETYGEWLPAVEQIDIRSDPQLMKQFSTCVPVAVFDGKVRFRGRIHEELLRRLIEGTAPVE